MGSCVPGARLTCSSDSQRALSGTIGLPLDVWEGLAFVPAIQVIVKGLPLIAIYVLNNTQYFICSVLTEIDRGDWFGNRCWGRVTVQTRWLVSVTRFSLSSHNPSLPDQSRRKTNIRSGHQIIDHLPGWFNTDDRSDDGIQRRVRARYQPDGAAVWSHGFAAWIRLTAPPAPRQSYDCDNRQQQSREETGQPNSFKCWDCSSKGFSLRLIKVVCRWVA